MIDATFFNHLVETIAPSAPVTASDACHAIELARLAAALERGEDPAERAALDTLSWDACSGCHEAYAFAPAASRDEFRARAAALIHDLQAPAARELAYAVACAILARDAPAELRDWLGIEPARADALARTACGLQLGRSG